MKNILFIHHGKGWGGAPINMINIINALGKTKFTIKVLLLNNSIVRKKLEDNNIEYSVVKSKFYKKHYTYFSHTVPGYTKWFQFYKQARLILSWVLSRYYFATKELKNHDFDIVHLNSSVLTDWLLPCHKRGMVVFHIQEPVFKGMLGLYYKFFRTQIIKYADRIVTISKDNAKRVNIPDKTTIVYNFTEINHHKPNSESFTSKKVLYVGGESFIKGFYPLIDALDYINKDIKILFAGNYSPVKLSWKRKIKKYLPFYRNKFLRKDNALKKMRSSQNAIEIGLVDDISSYLQEVSFLISPFTIEHFSRPIIEAFAHGKPVIATNIDGIDEVVTHNHNGLIVEKGQPVKLAEAINYLANEPLLCKEFGANGLKVAKEIYSGSNIKQIEMIYSQL